MCLSIYWIARFVTTQWTETNKHHKQEFYIRVLITHINYNSESTQYYQVSYNLSSGLNVLRPEVGVKMPQCPFCDIDHHEVPVMGIFLDGYINLKEINTWD